MNWNNFKEVGPPEKDVYCLVYKPNNNRCKFAIDKWIDLSKGPISWGRLVCTGDGWSNTEDASKITHWKYLKGPEDK